MKWTKEMYHYFAWKILEEVFGDSTDWSEKEDKVLHHYLDESKANLTNQQVNFVHHRVLKIKNDHNESLLYQLEKMYWHELHDYEDKGYLNSPIEFDKNIHEIWKQSVKERKSVEILYDSTTSGITKRRVDPYKTSSPYGEGYCHLRKEVRKFRFDRIIEIHITGERFNKPKVDSHGTKMTI